MHKELNFTYPFCAYERLNFINCFTSTYMYLENYKSAVICYCDKESRVCTSCSDCGASIAKKQEELFFLFGTISGFNSLRNSFNGQSEMQLALTDSDQLIDFIMSYAGYTYTKYSSNIKQAITRSIKDNKPVLARLTNKDSGSFRVISGYKKDSLICPDPSNAQKPPQKSPSYNDIDSVYIIENKAKALITLKQAFKQIIKVMEYNINNNFWAEYINQLIHLKKIQPSLNETIYILGRVAQTMWHTFNSHNFSQVFTRELYFKTTNSSLQSNYQKIRDFYNITHDLCWDVINIISRVEKSEINFKEDKNKVCDYIIKRIENIARYDIEVLNIIYNCFDLI